jgi:hypothetical protein
VGYIFPSIENRTCWSPDWISLFLRLGTFSSLSIAAAAAALFNELVAQAKIPACRFCIRPAFCTGCCRQNWRLPLQRCALV